MYIGDFEGVAVDADVFAEAEAGEGVFHFFPDSLANGFEVGELGHRCSFFDFTNCTIFEGVGSLSSF
jgi:hypothetical protein